MSRITLSPDSSGTGQHDPHDRHGRPSHLPLVKDVNLTQRLVTSLLLLPIVMLVVALGGWPFALLIGGGGLIGLLECYALAHARPDQGIALVGVPAFILLILGFFLGIPMLAMGALVFALVGALLLGLLRHRHEPAVGVRQAALTLAGLLYIGLPCGFLLELRHWPHGLIWLLLVLALTWGTDTFAYVGGRLCGKTPLAPALSPKKTREGAVFGYFGGLMPGLIILALNNLLTPAALVLCLIGPLVAILGDLAESAIKRAFGVKDSHIAGLNVLPGHGGVLDRIDALIAVSALCYLWVTVFGLMR